MPSAAPSEGEAQLAVTTDDAVAASAVIDAAYASLASGGWAPVAGA